MTQEHSLERTRGDSRSEKDKSENLCKIFDVVQQPGLSVVSALMQDGVIKRSENITLIADLFVKTFARTKQLHRLVSLSIAREHEELVPVREKHSYLLYLSTERPHFTHVKRDSSSMSLENDSIERRRKETDVFGSETRWSLSVEILRIACLKIVHQTLITYFSHLIEDVLLDPSNYEIEEKLIHPSEDRQINISRLLDMCRSFHLAIDAAEPFTVDKVGETTAKGVSFPVRNFLYFALLSPVEYGKRMQKLKKKKKKKGK